MSGRQTAYPVSILISYCLQEDSSKDLKLWPSSDGANYDPLMMSAGTVGRGSKYLDLGPSICDTEMLELIDVALCLGLLLTRERQGQSQAPSSSPGRSRKETLLVTHRDTHPALPTWTKTTPGPPACHGHASRIQTTPSSTWSSLAPQITEAKDSKAKENVRII